ncbi:CLUMA_CG020865, isoform A [Clunio marinus]|uniref:CLUMA_CG020865, isoform A n=1 Tax=Clunio marinus TaxID=568069 RepID=A0A1J1JAA7_9DIPT|nr:CLUMA_CG020865, isoform A [Clunio marinus]
MLNGLGLKCICNPVDCDVIRENDCPGKGLTVWDSCKCCKVCYKILGESCEGPGTCEPSLECVYNPPTSSTGICENLTSSSTDDPEECEKVPKILIISKKCKLVNVCRQLAKGWDFPTIEDCKLNLDNLLQKEIDADDFATVSNNH